MFIMNYVFQNVKKKTREVLCKIVIIYIHYNKLIQNFMKLKNKDDFLKLEKPKYRPKASKYNEKYIISIKNGIRVSNI